MNAIIKIGTSANGQPAVSGRELHAVLEVKTEYSHWFNRMVAYGFVENQDFEVYVKNDVNPQGGRPSTDHAVSLEMAKQIGMLQRTERGREVREYFLACEKKLLSPEYRLDVTTARLQIAECKLEIFGSDAEKVYDFDEAAAHLARYKKPPFGQNHLKAYLAKKGILCTAHYKNSKPIQRYLNALWFTPVVSHWKRRGKWRCETRYLLNNKGLMAIIDMMVRERLLHLPAPKNECFSFMSEPLPLETNVTLSLADELGNDVNIEMASKSDATRQRSVSR